MTQHSTQTPVALQKMLSTFPGERLRQRNNGETADPESNTIE